LETVYERQGHFSETPQGIVFALSAFVFFSFTVCRRSMTSMP